MRIVDLMASARKHRRILLAQLDGATRQAEAIERGNDREAIADQRRRVASLRAEISAHDNIHGTPPEQASGGLWGTTGPAQHGNHLHSSGPTLDARRLTQ